MKASSDWARREWEKRTWRQQYGNLFKFYFKGEQGNGMVVGDQIRVKRRVFKMGALSEYFFVNGNNPVEKRKLIREREFLKQCP